MQLRSLELHGFKSFPDKTIIEFDKGLTAVVGPNGSGKSNISDAIRWVLGEQSTKTLRGSKMEDVIFSGTQSRGQAGYASVVLNFDNRDRIFAVDDDIVSLKRKYYRSGDSEYYINGSHSRLKDINELLMDSGIGKEGFAVIGQGKIADIISSKSGDRREFFETAAGITKYRYRKEEAQKDLKSAAENMVRLMDILNELEVRVEPLKEQAKKAVEFNKLSQIQKNLDVFLAVSLLNSTNDKTKECNEKLDVIKKEYDEFEKASKEIEQKISDIYDFMQNKQIEIQNFTKQKEEITSAISQLTADNLVGENNITHETQNIENIDKTVDELKLNKDEFIQFLFEKNSILSTLTLKRDALATHIVGLQTQKQDMMEKASESESENAQIDKKMSEIKVFLSQAQYIISSKTKELTLAEETLSEYDTVKSSYEISNSRYEKDKEDALIAVNVVKEKIVSINNSIDGLLIKQRDKTEKAKEISSQMQNVYLEFKEKSSKHKMLSDMNDSLEGFSRSVKEIVSAYKSGKITGIIGTVSQIITAKAQHAVAVETAVGYAMQNIVVADEYVAKQSISYLAKNRLGRATFMPLTSVKGNKYNDNTLNSQTGFIGIGSDLVECDPKFKGIVDFMLGRIIVVDNLDNSTLIAKKYSYKFKIVTLDGQVINAGGTFTGGSQDRGIAPLSRNVTIEKLHEEILQLSKRQEQLKSEVNISKQVLTDIAQKITEFNAQKEMCQTDLAEFEREYNRIIIAHEQMKNLLKQNEDNFENTKKLTQTLQKEIDEFTINENDLSVKLNDITKQKEEVSQNASDVSTKSSDISQRITNLIIEKAECEKDIVVAQQNIEDIQKNSESISEKTTQLYLNRLALIGKIDDIKNQIDLNNRAIVSKKIQITQNEVDNQKAIDDRQLAEKDITTLRLDERQKAIEKERLSSQISRIEEQNITLSKEYDTCIARLWDEYQLTKTEAVALVTQLNDSNSDNNGNDGNYGKIKYDTTDISNISNAKSKLISIKQQIKSLGTVNVAAISEYEKVKARYDFLNKQIKDINTSTRELEKIINDLTINMKTEFERTFKEINIQFKSIFVELFGGGTANLTLSDPENILESGIEIFVSPPGKIVKNLSLLSGGEQAFIAVAIYFALLTVKPSPFCVLDEIEAALDEVNVVKYAKYLRILSEKTQFILITHRRGTMEEADTMYGVTMQNEGVSKILKLEQGV